MHTRTAKDTQSKHGCSSSVLLRALVAATASLYEAALSVLRKVEDPDTWLAIWETRQDAIDQRRALGELYLAARLAGPGDPPGRADPPWGDG